MENQFHATTIVAVRKNGKVAIAGDGQVTFGQSTIMKATARKIRKLHHGKILAGFAGSVADAFPCLRNLRLNWRPTMAICSGLQ